MSKYTLKQCLSLSGLNTEQLQGDNEFLEWLHLVGYQERKHKGNIAYLLGGNKITG